MRMRIFALMMALLLITGCGAASSVSESAVPTPAPAKPYTPVYTYKNADPDMVLISSPSGDVTYKDYRLYLDITADMSRMQARQSLALAALLEKDLKELGVKIDETAYQQQQQQEIAMLAMYNPQFPLQLEKIADALGNVSPAELLEIVGLSMRSQYLVYELGDHYTKLAEEELPPVAQAAPESSASSPESTAAPASEAPSDAPTASEPTEQQKLEAERAQQVQALVSQRLESYSVKADERIRLDDESALAMIDDEAVAWTDESKRFLDYAGASARLEAVSMLQLAQIMERELLSKKTTLDRTEFDAANAAYYEELRANEFFLETMEKLCKPYGATVDDYLLALDHSLWMQEIGNRYYADLQAAYEAIPADSPDRAPDFMQHCTATVEKLLEGSEIVNLMG